MPNIIMSLVGHAGSGKTSAAKYLEQTYGFRLFSLSAVIREYATEHNMPLEKRAEYALAHRQMIMERGWDYTLRLALASNAELLCIDGLRSPRFALALREAGGIEIAFDCPTEIRFAHVNAHPDKAKYPETIEQFIANEQEDEATELAPGIKFETEAVVRAAQYRVDATGTLEHTYRQLDAIMRKVL